MRRAVEWNVRDPWCLGYLGLAVVLGGTIGWEGATAWPATGCVLLAVALGILRPASAAVWSAALVLLVLVATVAGALTRDQAVEAIALASSAALAYAAAIALPVALVGLGRRRRQHRRQGWELARAVAAEETARAESALVRERAAMAGEIHDHLGHRLTLLTVQVGQLTLDPDLPPDAREALGRVRSGLAETAGDLGETVQLLKSGGMPSLQPADRSPSAVVREARSAGVAVEGDLPGALDGHLSPHARSAVVRVLSEGLTNAAKHAPGQTVRLAATVADGEAVLTVRNDLSDLPGAAGAGDDDAGSGPGSGPGSVPGSGSGTEEAPMAASSGHGLRSLRHRLALLGGRLDVEQGGETFGVRATVPVDAAPGPGHPPGAVVEEVLRTEREADAHARRAGRVAWLVPAGLAVGAVLLTVGFYLYLAVASTLSPAEFARIEVGMSQGQAQDLLPPVQTIEAPRDVLPEPAGATCQYHEESVSLFAREDVFRICFARDEVVSADVIPAGLPTDGDTGETDR